MKSSSVDCKAYVELLVITDKKRRITTPRNGLYIVQLHVVTEHTHLVQDLHKTESKIEANIVYRQARSLLTRKKLT